MLDNAHAADEASRRLIALIAPRLTGRVLLVVAADEAERAPNAELGSLLETRGLRRLWLHAVGVSDVEAMLGSMVLLGAADRHALAARLHQETGGLPHDVCAVVTALVDDHLLVVDGDGTWRTSPALAGRPLPLPASVRDRVRARLDRLTPAAADVAGAIAVLGTPSEAGVIEEVSELSPDAVEAALASLMDRRILHESDSQRGRYEFTSALTARAVAANLAPERRRALHGRSAEVLVRRDLAATAERSLLPYHRARAEPRAEESAPAPRRAPWTRRTRIAAGVGVAAVVTLVGFSLRSGRMPFRSVAGGESADAMPIVALGRIADYRQNRSDELTKPLTDMLATNLGRVGRMRVVSTARMYELVSQRDGGRDTSAAAVVSAARRAGATELVDGALYAMENGGMRLDLRRVELATGNLRKTHSVRGVSLFELADSGTAQLAADFGQTTPLGSVADVTTRSLPAYHLYEQGLRAYYANDRRTAERLFEAALVEDSTFAMAAYYDALSAGEARAVSVARFERAARLATHTTDRERLTILARQASVITSSPSLRALADTLTVRYPDEVEGYFFTGVSLLSDGEFLAALAPFRRVVSMDSLALTGVRALCNACDALRQIASAYQLADSMDATEREVRRWIRLQPKSSVAWHTLSDILAQRGRVAEAMVALQNEAAFDPTGIGSDRLSTLALQQMYSRQFDEAERSLRASAETGNPVVRRESLWYLALSNRQQGRLAEALTNAKQFRVAWAPLNVRASGAARDAVPTQSLVEAQVLFELGRYREAAALFDSVSRWSPPEEMQSQLGRSRAWNMTHAATALASAGDTAGLAARADTVQALGARSGFARDRRLHHHVRGLLYAARGNDDAAIEEFRRAIYSWSMGYTRTNIALATVLIRQRRHADAIAALQPVLHGPLESSNYYVTRTEAHDLLAQAWDGVPGAAAHDSAAAHYAIVAESWQRADPIFAERVARARSRK